MHFVALTIWMLGRDLPIWRVVSFVYLCRVGTPHFHANTVSTTFGIWTILLTFCLTYLCIIIHLCVIKFFFYIRAWAAHLKNSPSSWIFAFFYDFYHLFKLLWVIFFFKNSLLKYIITAIFLLVKIIVNSVIDLKIRNYYFRFRSLCETCNQKINSSERAEDWGVSRSFFPGLERVWEVEVGSGTLMGFTSLSSQCYS